MSAKIKLYPDQSMLVMVKGGKVIHFTPDMALPHVEFVRRKAGSLPAGLQAACDLDDGSGTPIFLHSLSLKQKKNN